jgi:hypothetical protein
MTARESFRFGFLKSCAEQGLDVKQAQDLAQSLVEKRAVAGALGGVVAALEGAKSLAGSGLQALAMPLLMAPVAAAGIGGAGGYLAAQLGNRGGDLKHQVGAAHKRELIEAYNLYAQRAQDRTALQQEESSAPPVRGMRI